MTRRPITGLRLVWRNFVWVLCMCLTTETLETYMRIFRKDFE